ncbi:scaffolding protein [Klebsiella phage K1-ULIP33]|uniref:Scaffolding protein n=1 Tax=Klebsiella phage K1-ULIP33 TaxID=2307015 RepID=A0A4P6DBI2_9CAUD|nr:scaffolding protein [Klebsiella phage K1-ULIP33]
MAFSFTEPTTTHPTSDTAPEETQEATTDVTTDTDTVDTNADVQSGTGDTDAGDAGGEDPKGETSEGEGKEEDKPAESSQEEVNYFFGGEEVTIEVPQDVEEELKAKGLDAHAIAAELYAKDGDFSLSEETKQKLYDAFGKFAVDAYLSGLKAQNEAFMLRSENEAKEREAADVQRFTDTSKECGGEEGWNRLEEWALEALSDDELTAFNAVMQSGNQYLQMYAVRELEARRKAAQGDDEVTLVQPSAPAVDASDNSPLSAQEYIREISQLSQRFGRDRKAAAEAQAKLDARRRAGMAKGL